MKIIIGELCIKTKSGKPKIDPVFTLLLLIQSKRATGDADQALKT
jgi:hypothetical protein